MGKNIWPRSVLKMTESAASGPDLRRKTVLNLIGLAAVATWALLGTANVNQVGAQSTAENQPQNIADTWQGTLHGGRDLRQVFKISKADGAGYKGFIYSIDQASYGLPISEITFESATVKMVVAAIGGSFEGKLSADGKTIVGIWSQGNPRPLTLARATLETSWTLPEAPPEILPMPEIAEPSFEVATIKPNKSGAPSLQVLTFNGRDFTARNSSLVDLITFAYDVQARQIVGAPEWVDKDRYDIAAVPAEAGAPSDQQLKTMIRKLLAERFKLTFHNDKRELSVYVLTVLKNGHKLSRTKSQGSQDGINQIPGAGELTLNMVNATVPDFTGYLQMLVLDRPVVDRTGIMGRFDFQCRFTPDDSQFSGHPPPLPPPTDTANSSPGLFEAIQQQLGMQLDAEKIPVDVIAIDHVEKPSPN
jgi:uncharacterized protein (TIGR03435 family)